ncbi:MAG: response regulator [Myxococcaceae bacterium]|nr:response regulator [Myxococcaceae bacterium]
MLDPRSGIPPAPASRGRLLLVDDEENILRSIKRVLRRGNWEIECAGDGATALEVLRTFRPQVVISDFRMPGMNGVEFLARVKAESPKTQRIMLTGQADQHAIEDAINRSEIFRLVSKPWDDAQLVLTVHSAFEQVALAEENERLLRLTQSQNEELRRLNAELEERVRQRTRLLSAAKREWEKSFDSIHDPLVLVRVATDTILRANLAFSRMVGRDIRELIDQKSHQVSPCQDTLGASSCPIQRAMATGQEQRAELKNNGRTWALTVYPMVEDGIAVCSFRDVTDEREVTRRMIETEKMAAVGQLAGGVAHEINNPLGGILAFAQLMKREEGRSEADLEALGLIEESALRCKRIVESLLKISRRSRDDERRKIDLSRCVEDTVVLFQARLKGSPRARLETRLSPAAPPIHADAGQLSQVVLNLLTNALQALPNEEGTITVETYGQDGRAFVRVSDTGVGMDARVRERIFEPLFTTKPPGVGTGLGLSIAYRIVEDHGGTISVESEPGRGATFTLSFPEAL